VDGSEWIALVAVGGGVLVGFVGPIIAGAQQRRAEHEKHTRDRRADTYIDMLVSLERDLTFMARTYPIIGPAPEPPAGPNDQEHWTLNARVAAYGSKQVQALLDRWNEKIVREFWLESATLRDMESSERRLSRAVARDEWGATPTEQYRKLQDIRGQAKALLTEIRRVVAYELQISSPSGARQDPSDRFNAWLDRNGREQLPQRDDLTG
jgi:hypothetical protein